MASEGPSQSQQTRKRKSHLEDYIEYLEGPWDKMPDELLASMEKHCAKGGELDFISSRWPLPNALTYGRPGYQTRFELQGCPNLTLVAGRFAYKKKHQIIIVKVPFGPAKNQTMPAIVLHHKDNIFAPNSHGGSYGYRYSVWKPEHLRKVKAKDTSPMLFRIFSKIDSPASIEYGQATKSPPSAGKKRQNSTDTDCEPPTKMLKISFTATPTISESDLSKPKLISSEGHLVKLASATPVFSGTPTVQQSSVIPPTDLDVTFAANKGVIPSSGDHVDTPANANMKDDTMLPTSSAENNDSASGSAVPKNNEIMRSTSAPVLRLRRVELPAGPEVNSPDNHSPSLRAAKRLEAEHVGRIPREGVIEITDDGEVKVKEEDVPRTVGLRTSISPSSQNVSVPYSSCETATACHSPLMSFDSSGQVDYTPASSQYTDCSTSTPMALYENVKIQFEDLAGNLQDEKPFSRCRSARHFFDLAVQADIIEPNIRMFVIQIEGGRATRMIADDEESFQEKLVGPLNRVIGNDCGTALTIRVRGYVYDRA